MAAKQPFVMMSCCYQYCMPGATNYVLSDENRMNDNNTSTSFSSLSVAAAAVAVVVYPTVLHTYSI